MTSVGSPTSDGVWVGATDLGHEGDWQWVDGSAVSKDYWNKDEPNNSQDNEHCAEVSGGGLNDVNCDRMYLYICSLQPGGDELFF